VNYAFARKKLSFTTPIIILKYIAISFSTVLFLPFMDYFISIVACVTNPFTDKKVHTFFTDEECWTGIHVLHAVFAILGSMLFFVISGVISLTYFEYKSNSNDPTAR